MAHPDSIEGLRQEKYFWMSEARHRKEMNRGKEHVKDAVDDARAASAKLREKRHGK